MPFSDHLPAYVIPYSPEWRWRAKFQDWPELDDPIEGMTAWEYCYSYTPTDFMDTQAAMNIDKRHRDCLPCARRDATGDRNHQWCYRCPAGMMHTQLHIYDAALTRDRTMLLY